MKMELPTENNGNEQNELSFDTMIVLVKYNQEDITLHDIYIKKNKFKIGRAVDCDEHILTPVISRNHCIFIYNNNQWTITDLSSSSTILNGNKLERGVPERIEVGDIIQLSEDEDYKFEVTMYMNDQPEKKKLRISQNLLDEEILKQKLFTEEQNLKRQELEVQLIEKQKEQEKLKTQLDNILKSKEAAEGKTEKLNQTINLLEEKIRSGNEVESKLQQNYDNLLSAFEIQQQQFNERLNAEREKWQQTLEMSNQEKVTLESNMAKQLAEWREQQKNEWNDVIKKLVQHEKDMQMQLKSEKELLEQRLKEANDALKQTTVLAEKLKNSVQNTPVILVGVAAQEKVCATIDLTKDDVSNSSTEPSTIVDKVGHIMDEQLTCQICAELFVTAVTLNCSHTYCQYCIYAWMKKKPLCPICRGEIISITRSLVLDNFIEKMINDLSTQHKERRKELCTQRNIMTQRLGVPKILKRRPCRVANNSR